MDRDYSDFQDKNLAIYNFRGYTVLRFYKDKKFLQFGENAELCEFVPDDFKLMSEFLNNCYKFSVGEISDIENIEVN